MAKKIRSHLHDQLIPHKGNGFKPLLFTATGVGAVIVVLLLVQAAYFVQTKVVFKHTDFLASVLPGVLATLTNQDRAKSGIPSLSVDAHLSQAAQLKADDMAAKGYFSHVDPEGRQPWYWLQKAGYEYAYAGENLAVNFTDSEDVQEAWMNSPTHHANIVKPQYTRIGIGVAQGTYQGKDTTFVVQFFATPKSVAVAVPVAASPESEPILAGTSSPESDSQVLGAETAPEPVTEPQEATIVPEVQDTASAELASGVVAPALSFFAQVAASPNHTIVYVLAGLAGFFALLLLIAVAVHIKVQYLEVLGGGLIILLVALSLLVFNAMNDTEVVIPDESQPASDIGAF